MYRPFLITGLILSPLLSIFSGCGGSPEVAQNAPPPASSSPAASGGGSSESNAMMAPSDNNEGSGSAMAAPLEGMAMSSGPSGMQANSQGGEESAMGGRSAEGMGDMGDGGGMSSYGAMGNQGYGNSAMGQNEGGAMGPEGMGMMGPGNGEGMGMGMGGMGMGGMGMGGMGPGQFAPPEDPAPAEDADYLTKGRYAFSIGKEKEALEYARAHAIAAADGADILQKTKWFAIGTRPVSTTRFAVGVVLEAPATMTDFKPIGSKQFQNGGGGGGGRENMMMGGPGGAAANSKASKEHAFYDLTGSFGEAVVAGFQERWASGNFGSVYNDVETFVPKPPIGNNGMAGGMGMMGMGGMRGGPPSGMDGMGMEGMAGMGGGGMPGEGGQSTTRAKIMPGSVVVPGMVYIGSAEKQADLMKKAEDRGVDLVFLFDVKVSPPNRMTGTIQNEAKVRVVSMKGEPMARSGELLNTKVERELMKTAGEDEVAAATNKFLAVFDEKVKLSNMPPLKPEHAKSRLVQVLSNTKSSKLEKLFEVSLYHSMKLISDDDKLTACLIVMEGSEGESIANGRPEDKQAVLDTLLPNYK